MKHSQCYTLFSTLLAVLVISSLSLSTVQSSNMKIKMAISADMDGMSSDGYGSCPGGDDAAAANCDTICIVTAFATLPVSENLVRTLQADRFEVFPATPRDGPVSIEPNPPKHHNFS